MTKALLVIGAGVRFLDTALEFRDFLKNEAGVDTIELSKPAYSSPFELRMSISAFLTETNPDDVILLGYCGHGSQIGWAYSSDGEQMLFKLLVEIIGSLPNRVLVVSECCYSYNLIKLMITNGVPADRCGVIASGHGIHGNCLTDWMLIAWRQGKNYQPISGVERIQLVADAPRASLRGRIYERWLRIRSRLHDIGFSFLKEPAYGGCIHDLDAFRTVPLSARTYRPDDPSNPFPVRWGADLDHFFFPKGEQTPQ